jgi:beta-mannosidase
MNTSHRYKKKLMLRKLFATGLVIVGLSSCTTENAENLITIELTDHWEFRQKNTETWYNASVPRSVHSDLLANGVIDDPFYRLNEKDLQWIDKVDWEYRTVFLTDEEVFSMDRVEIIFEGIDTYAEVFLNDVSILTADNMFRTWVVDVSDKLVKGENELRVLFESPTRKGLEALSAFGFQLAADNDQSENGEMGADRVSPYVRKAPYHFGWDWGPRLVTSGIWRGIELRAWSNARIVDVQIVAHGLTGDEADLLAELEIEAAVPGEYVVDVSYELTDKPPRNSAPPLRNSVKLIKGKNKVQVPVRIDQPALWNPNGVGNQAIYNFKFDLYKDTKLIDSRAEKTGLRTVALVRNPDPDGQGESFYFEVNGKALFAKGANYIPNDVFLNRVSAERYEFIVRSAAEANMNMLRVWGGGIYEDDLFYDLCDKYGIMVWQDFMFACAMYPGNDAFLESVRLEAVDNVKRLRNHPSIVLWCGNNEIEAAWGPYDENRGWGWKQRYDAGQRAVIWKAYDTLFHKILPEVVSQEDAGRAYWHSSPSAGMGELAGYDTRSGDMHYWGVWHGLHPLTDFRKYKARFMSEYGFQSFPEFSSVKKYTLPEDWNIESEVMAAHQRSGIGNLRIRQYMEEDYLVPEDFEQSLYAGQLLQAEAIKLAIESHRADMPYCMGSLYWQLNDCWPVASWSGIDNYGKWKALHYFVREAFKPIALVSSEDDDTLKIKLVSDFNETGNWILETGLMDFAGKVLWSDEVDIEMPSQLCSFSLSEMLGGADPASVVLVSRLKEGDRVLDTDLHYFVRPKDMKLTDPELTYTFLDKGNSVEVQITSKSLAKNVFIYSDGLEGNFSDNFFDVLPGETLTVSAPNDNTTRMSPDSIFVMHLFKTF